MLLATNQFSAFSHTPSLKEILGAPEVGVFVVRLPIMGRAVPRHAAMLFPVKHIDLMSDKPQVSPSIISDVAVDVVDVTPRLGVSHQIESDSMLEERLVPQVNLLVSGADGRFNQLSVFGKVIGVVNPPKLTRLWAVAKAALKFTGYRLQFHVASILFPQVMSNHG
jgi:hypothetical protein